MVTEEELRAAERRYEDLLGRVRRVVECSETIANGHNRDACGNEDIGIGLYGASALIRIVIPEAFKDGP